MKIEAKRTRTISLRITAPVVALGISLSGIVGCGSKTEAPSPAPAEQPPPAATPPADTQAVPNQPYGGDTGASPSTAASAAAAAPNSPQAAGSGPDIQSPEKK